jgi:Flp pilus assembly protein TadG
MRFRRHQAARGAESGQSLIESALLIPILLLFIFNVINFAYYFMVGIHLASAPREGVQYSVMGFATPEQLSLPAAGPADSAASISYLTYNDMAALAGTTAATIRVCSTVAGTQTQGVYQVARCWICTSSTDACTSGSGSFPTPELDPEPTAFKLHRVDVEYVVTPLIPGQPFGITLLPSYTFRRQVSMRAMN